MNNIDKQAHKMRNYLNTAVISGMKLLHLTTDELSALLDELEAKYRKILKLEKLAESESVGADKAAASCVEWMKRCHDAEKRIAELESLAAPKLTQQALVVPDERAEFETFMEKRFKDFIDRRLVKNGDGEYFAWDMQVAWIVWQERAAMLQCSEPATDNTNQQFESLSRGDK